MKSAEWEKEIDKLSKDELTIYLSAYERLREWDAFKREFQLGYFSWMVPYIKERIEKLAALEMAETDLPAPP